MANTDPSNTGSPPEQPSEGPPRPDTERARQRRALKVGIPTWLAVGALAAAGLGLLVKGGGQLPLPRSATAMIALVGWVIGSIAVAAMSVLGLLERERDPGASQGALPQAPGKGAPRTPAILLVIVLPAVAFLASSLGFLPVTSDIHEHWVAAPTATSTGTTEATAPLPRPPPPPPPSDAERDCIRKVYALGTPSDQVKAETAEKCKSSRVEHTVKSDKGKTDMVVTPDLAAAVRTLPDAAGEETTCKKVEIYTEQRKGQSIIAKRFDIVFDTCNITFPHGTALLGPLDRQRIEASLKRSLARTDGRRYSRLLLIGHHDPSGLIKENESIAEARAGVIKGIIVRDSKDLLGYPMEEGAVAFRGHLHGVFMGSVGCIFYPSDIIAKRPGNCTAREDLVKEHATMRDHFGLQEDDFDFMRSAGGGDDKSWREDLQRVIGTLEDSLYVVPTDTQAPEAVKNKIALLKADFDWFRDRVLYGTGPVTAQQKWDEQAEQNKVRFAGFRTVVVVGLVAEVR